ncbi:MAG: DinB family protein [Candidatus Korobacteraceae bacterium]
MTGADLVKMFDFSFAAIHRNLEDVSEAESLVKPPDGGNCYWVLGHIVIARGGILTLVGETPVCPDAQAAPYRRGISPSETDSLLDLATLRGYLSDSQLRLLPALAAMSEAKLAGPVPEPMNRPPLTGSIGDALIRLQYHEGYHNGQLGLLRRIAGKDGAIP